MRTYLIVLLLCLMASVCFADGPPPTRRFLVESDSGAVSIVKAKPPNTFIGMQDLLLIWYFSLYTGGANYALYDSSDVPSDGDVLTWNTGNTLDWQPDAGGGADGNDTLWSLRTDRDSLIYISASGDTFSIYDVGNLTQLSTTNDTLRIFSSGSVIDFSGNALFEVSSIYGRVSGTGLWVSPRTGGELSLNRFNAPGSKIVIYDSVTAKWTFDTDTLKGVSGTVIKGIDSLDTDKYTDGSIDLPDLAADAVDSTKIKDGSVSLINDLREFTEGELEAALGDVSEIFTDNTTGDVVVSGGSQISPGVIVGDDLNASNSPTDNYLLSYNSGGSNFTWVVSPAGGTGVWADTTGVIDAVWFVDSEGDTLVVFQDSTNGQVVMQAGDNQALSIVVDSVKAGIIYSTGAESGTWTGFGATSGSASITVADVAGTPSEWVLPTSDGSSGNHLETDGSGVLSWETSGGAGSSLWDSSIVKTDTILYQISQPYDTAIQIMHDTTGYAAGTDTTHIQVPDGTLLLHGTADVADSANAIPDDYITQGKVDTTASFVVGDIFKVTSAAADSEYSTHEFVREEIEDSLNEYSVTTVIEGAIGDTANDLRAEMGDSAREAASDSLALALLKTGGTMSGDINVNGNKVLSADVVSSDTIIIGTEDSLYHGHIGAYFTRLEVHNATGATLDQGTPVYISGATGNIPNADSARADNVAMMPAMGVMEHDVANGADGHVVYSGVLGQFNTNAWAVGDPIYVQPTGGIDTVRPTNGNFVQKIGEVTRVNPSQGSIYIAGAGRINDLPNAAASGEIFIGGPDSVMRSQAISGDATLDSAGALTIPHVADNSQAHTDYVLNTGDIISGNVTLDDGTGNSPVLIFTDGDDETFTLEKQDAGTATISNSEGAIRIQPSGDVNDYLYVSTTTGIVTLTTQAGDNGDLVISAGGGDISFADDNLSGTGAVDFGGATSFEIPNSANPTTDAAGEIALDTDADGDYIDQGWLTYYDGSTQMFVPAFDAIGTPSDGDVISYDATGDKWEVVAQIVGAVDSTNISANSIAESDINWTTRYIDLDIVHGWDPSDTTILSLPRREGYTPILFRDSTAEASKKDTAYVTGTVPWTCTVDSIVFAYKVTGASVLIDSLVLRGPDRSAFTNLCDSTFWESGTNRTSTSIARIAIDVTDFTANAGDRFGLWFANDLAADNGTVKVYYIQLVTKQ